MATKDIIVDYIARVEGESGLKVKISGNKVKEVYLDLWEAPRFFESFLVGRRYDEVADITSRICGICSVSHQMTALYAIENALGVKISQQTRDLRKLLALSQLIMNLNVQIYFFSLPDYLGYQSVFGLAENPQYLPHVQRALRIKRIANDLTRLIGGRETHPMTAVVGGFTRLPDRLELKKVLDSFRRLKEDAWDTVRFVSTLSFPVLERQSEHLALSSPHEYAINEGRIVSTTGLDIEPEDFYKHITSCQRLHTNALYYHFKKRGTYMVGSLPRININYQHLSADARNAAEMAGVRFPNFNPFVSVLARAIESVHMVDECIQIMQRLKLIPERSRIKAKAGEGCWITEAERGVLYHAYKLDKYGYVKYADIVTPTAQNAFNIEKDLLHYLPSIIQLSKEEMGLKCESLIRSYDPCFSCSVHFLKLEIETE